MQQEEVDSFLPCGMNKVELYLLVSRVSTAERSASIRTCVRSVILTYVASVALVRVVRILLFAGDCGLGLFASSVSERLDQRHTIRSFRQPKRFCRSGFGNSLSMFCGNRLVIGGDGATNHKKEQAPAWEIRVPLTLY